MTRKKVDDNPGGSYRSRAGISASFRQGSKGKYIRNGKTISGRLHDELVMMDIDQGMYFSLNPVATRIWDLLENPLNLDDLCRLLYEEYEVEPVECQQDVEAYIAEMISLGLILKC